MPSWGLRDLPMSLWRWKKLDWIGTKRFRNLFCSHWDSAWCMSPMKLQMKTWSCPSMPFRFKLKLCFQQLCNTAVSGPGLTKLKILKPFSNQFFLTFIPLINSCQSPSCPNPFNLGWLRHTPIIASGVPQDSHHLKFAKSYASLSHWKPSYPGIHTCNAAHRSPHFASKQNAGKLCCYDYFLNLGREHPRIDFSFGLDWNSPKILIFCFNCLRAKTVAKEAPTGHSVARGV